MDRLVYLTSEQNAFANTVLTYPYISFVLSKKELQSL